MMSQKKRNAIASCHEDHQIFNDDVSYCMALEAKLQTDASRKENIEVDSCGNGIYRVWKGKLIIGLIKRCPRTQFWIAEPAGLYNPRRYPSSELAVSAVIRAWEGA